MRHQSTAEPAESAEAAAPEPVSATPTRSRVLVDGEEVALGAYNIGGYNYFKLRDVAKAIDFGVTWDCATNTVGIDSTLSYAE